MMKKTITYACNGTCSPDDRTIHLSPDEEVTLYASNIDASIHFKNNRSPFKSGDLQIDIPKGQTRDEVVGSQNGDYEYTLACKNPRCPSSVGDPKMIVP
jgi:hypothetical protein